jgi:hypothetical protein
MGQVASIGAPTFDAALPSVWRRSLIVQAAACFAVARLISTSVMAALAGRDQLSRRLGSWDGGYYLRIARTGYPRALPHGPGKPSRVAFFPVYPSLIRAAHWFVPGSALVAAVTVSLLAGLLAAGLIAVLTERVLLPLVDPVTARRAALIVVATWTVEPASFVLSMAYSEAVFTALAAGCLLALVARNWWTAGVLALFAGATRPTGIVLAGCCAVAAAGELSAWRDRDRGHSASAARQAGVPVAAAALAPLGAIAFIVWIGRRIGHLDAWFVAQRQGWQVYTDGGRYLVQKVAQYARHPAARPSGLAVIAVLVVAVVLAVLMLRDRPPLVLGGYALALVVLTLIVHGAFGSIPRFLLPAFPLLLPVGTRAARLPTRVLVGAFAVAAVAVGLAATWVTGQSVLPP